MAGLQAADPQGAIIFAHSGYWPAIPHDQSAWITRGFPIKRRVKRCIAALPSSKAICSLQLQAAACAEPSRAVKMKGGIFLS